MNKPEVGDRIRVFDARVPDLYHICTVTDLLSTQLRATYEEARADGGWTERTRFVFYRDLEWDIRVQAWKGVAG